MSIGNRTLKERRSHFAFALWAIQQPKPPTVAAIQALTGLSYNSARQWRRDWCAALAPKPPAEVNHAHDL
jgi:glycerol uptake facilitator-like aquaporin